MKKGRFYFIVILIVVLSVNTQADKEPLESEYESLLIGQARPELTGIEQLYIDLHLDNSISHVDMKTLEDIHKQIESRLVNANINVISRPFLDSRPILSLADSNLHLSKLRIDIESLELEEPKQCVFRIQTSLATKVYLTKPSKLLIEADFWKSESVMQAVLFEDMPLRVTDVVLVQVDTFIQAYKSANPPGEELSVADSDIVIRVPEEQAESNLNIKTAEHNYVASRSSEVFHKYDCRWAQNISQENLVIYSNREEAINAGKRPCKTCNP